LLEVIRKFYYSDISALLVMILVTVMLIDAITERVRYRLLGKEAKQ
jgi:phosphonate transport system permease protein